MWLRRLADDRQAFAALVASLPPPLPPVEDLDHDEFSRPNTRPHSSKPRPANACARRAALEVHCGANTDMVFTGWARPPAFAVPVLVALLRIGIEMPETRPPYVVYYLAYSLTIGCLGGGCLLAATRVVHQVGGAIGLAVLSTVSDAR